VTPDDVAPVLRRITGREPVAWEARDEGAYSASGRWVVRWADGGTAFVKAEAEPDDHYGVAVEHLVYSSVSSPVLPGLVAYDGGPPLVLVTENLSRARWGTPVTAADARALGAAFDALASVRAPEGLRPVPFGPRWAGFVADPAPLLATGLVSEAWAAASLPVLAAAETGAGLAGDRLVHCDVWLQNWCRAERGVVLVDWAGSAAANPLVMRAWGEAAVRAADGPAGLVLAGHPEWAAWVAGQAAYFLTRDHGIERLVETQRREALATLRWAAGECGVPPPDPGPVFATLGPWRP
jgi:hypothetical protein